jgi:hypothetical protein
MPLPIVPAPQTQIVLIVTRSELDGKDIVCRTSVKSGLLCFMASFTYLTSNFLFMDTNQPPFFSTQNIPSPSPGIFGTKIPSSVAFAVGILLFLLPFAEIKCNNATLMQNSGLGIAMGSEWKMSEKNMLGGLGGGESSSQLGNTKKDPNFYAIAALALGLTGLILSLFNAKAASGSALVSGVLSAGALIGLWIDLKKEVNTSLADTEKTGGLGMGIDKVSLSLQLTPWFYVAVVAFLVAAFFCYKRIQLTK